MRFALNKDDIKIEVNKSGEKGICPTCKSEVIGKYGEIRTKHWSHKVKDCDDWHEPITDWHIKWQNYFPIENQEITLYDNEKNEFHRADIRLNNGVVIEIQNSPIKSIEIEQRENFYGKNGLIWILNGENLMSKSELVTQFKPKINKFELTVPTDVFTELEFYNMDEFKSAFYNSNTFRDIKNHRNLENIDCQNGDLIIFKFNDNINMDYLQYLLKLELKKLCKELFINYDIFERETNFKIIQNKRDSFFKTRLIKKNWRKFIDKMEFPVFIDKLSGLNENYIYWLQENKIVSKEIFLKKYLKYT
ncbi:competence protein CoiA [Lutibacter aestuarii]|uniref:Competence protein CoiA n=1 Tax=Lutibacter aestuarii TaxID=861111 RepID=A0ABW2Z9P6_9FLAO